MPPEASRIHWPRWAHLLPWLSRRLFGEHDRRPREHRWWQDEAAGHPLVVTETGWEHRVDPGRAGAYLSRELTFYRELGVELVAVYAHAHMLEAGRPTPQADAIRRFVEEIANS